MISKKKEENAEIIIKRPDKAYIDISIIGDTPMIFNAMSEKVKLGLLLGGTSKSRSERASTLRQNPLQEYRDSVYRFSGEDSPTRLGMPGTAVKAMLMSATTDIPGVFKTTIGKHVWAEGEMIPVYGVPAMFMAVTRQAGPNKAPQMTTRALVKNWAMKLKIKYTRPLLTDTSVVNLLDTAGISIGLSDFRPEKGKGNYGQFHVATGSELKEVARLIKTGGKKAQDAALEKPGFHDVETEQLYLAYEDERKLMGR